jgi:hypothetical protein
MTEDQPINGISRRRILQASVVTAGIVGLGVGPASANHAQRGLVRRDAHRKGIPFEVTNLPVPEVEKQFTCNRNESKELANCYDIEYDDGVEEDLAFEVPVAEDDVEIGDKFVFGPMTCFTQEDGAGRLWHLTFFEEQ